jgi:hypothetical protein
MSRAESEQGRGPGLQTCGGGEGSRCALSKGGGGPVPARAQMWRPVEREIGEWGGMRGECGPTREEGKWAGLRENGVGFF